MAGPLELPVRQGLIGLPRKAMCATSLGWGQVATCAGGWCVSFCGVSDGSDVTAWWCSARGGWRLDPTALTRYGCKRLDWHFTDDASEWPELEVVKVDLVKRVDSFRRTLRTCRRGWAPSDAVHRPRRSGGASGSPLLQQCILPMDNTEAGQ